MNLKINSLADYKRVYQYSITEPENFWESIADTFYWRKKWDQVLEWDFKKPDIKWFNGAQLNI